MKLKSIKKVSASVRYIIRVFDGREFVEDFVIDYIGMTNEELREVIVKKYLRYENHTVRHIDTEINDGKSYLCVSINL